MNDQFHLYTKKTLVLTALAAGALLVGVARADDSSMNPFTGESYAAFNGGHDRPAISNPHFAQGPSAWREANRGGIPERL